MTCANVSMCPNAGYDIDGGAERYYRPEGDYCDPCTSYWEDTCEGRLWYILFKKHPLAERCRDENEEDLLAFMDYCLDRGAQVTLEELKAHYTLAF